MHHCHHDTSFMSLLCKHWVGWWKWLTDILRVLHFVLLIINSLLKIPCFGIHMRHKYLHTVPTPSDPSIYLLLPQTSFLPILQSCSFQVPDHPVQKENQNAKRVLWNGAWRPLRKCDLCPSQQDGIWPSDHLSSYGRHPEHLHNVPETQDTFCTLTLNNSWQSIP